MGSIVMMLAIDSVTRSHSDLAFELCHGNVKLAMLVKSGYRLIVLFCFTLTNAGMPTVYLCSGRLSNSFL